MERFLRYKPNILEIFLILSPIIDIFTSICERIIDINMSIGTIVRSTFLLLITLFVLFKSTSKYRKISIIYFCITALYSGFFFINIYINKGYNNIIFEIKEYVKTIFFPICTIGLLNYFETKKYKIDYKLYFFIIIEYITLLFIPGITNLSFESYSQDKIGTIGWFFSGNEISNIYAILIVFVIFNYDNIKNNLVYLAITSFCLYTIMQIGTKIPAISALFTIIVFVSIKLIHVSLNKYRINIKFISTFIVLFMIYGLIFVNSPVFKNFDIYKNYLIDNREILTEIRNMDENIENEEKPVDIANNTDDKTLTNNEIATIIHSGRIETKNEISKKFHNSGILEKMLGLGKLDILEETQNLSEIDYFDILYNYGYVGFIIYFAPIIYIVIGILKNIKIKEIVTDNTLCAYIISLLIAIFLCAISGHTYTAPAVSIFISLILTQLFQEIVERKEEI